MRTTNLKYIGWVEEIIGVDYKKFELIVLYCKWMQANIWGARATIKHDEYDFTMIKFDHLIPYSSYSFAFPLHMQQVFFVDDVGNLQWKVVLQKEAQCTRVASKMEGRPGMLSLNPGKDEEHFGLRPRHIAEDVQPCRRSWKVVQN